MKHAAAGLAGIVGLLALIWLFQGNDFFLYRAFAPKYEQVRRETFKQSQAYNDGVAQDLNGFRRDYALADSTGKRMIAATIRHRLANYDASQLSPDLRAFLSSLPE